MQIFKSGTALRIETAESREAEPQILRFPAHSEPVALGLRPALEALGVAYAKVAHALNLRLEVANCDAEELSQLSNSCSWISDRQRLVQSFLDCELAAAAAYVEMRNPDQIHALAEAAGAFAEENRQLFSALGLLSYIEHELGWAAARMAPAGNA